MALPGLLKQKRGGLFGSMPTVERGPYDTPGIGDGMTAAANPMAPAKPKFFGEGGVGRAIAGNIGDFLLQYSGMDPIYNPAMQQRQAIAYDQQQREMQRRQGLQDWVWKQEYERDNPKPRDPTYFDDNAGNRWAIGPDGKPQMVFHDQNTKRVPTKVVDSQGREFIEYIEIPNAYNPDGTPRAAGGQPMQALPEGFTVRGGPTQPASGTFRR